MGILLAAYAIALGATTHTAQALEGKGDLNVQLRLVETVPGAVKTGSSASGIARIDILVEAFRATQGIRLAVVKADGTEWTFRSRPFAATNLTWTDPGGEPFEPDAAGPTVPARGAIRTEIAVPLEGAAIHEIVIKILGTVDGEPIATEGVLRVALGVPDGLPVEDADNTYANFPLQEVK
ncbi:MAG TPA: hypothetical protein VFB67_02165 [Candidatus Polarisedimenticolaceae bacterium]|nr:hypothetical protein [Candidatus Polarisedimenticolaceae bacterium]